MYHPTPKAQSFANIFFSDPLATVFHVFPSLPSELRVKIWGYTSLHTRIIEIERGPKVRDGYELIGLPCAGDEYRCRVSPASRQPPVGIQFLQTIPVFALPYMLATS